MENNIVSVDLNSIRNNILTQLGLSENNHNLESPELISCLLRRAAGLLCPTTKNTLINSVIDPLKLFLENRDIFKEKVVYILDNLIAYGDIFEFPDINEFGTSLDIYKLYLSPPSFVKRASGPLLILGIPPDNNNDLPDYLMKQIEYSGYARFLPNESNDDNANYLKGIGFIELNLDKWLKQPLSE